MNFQSFEEALKVCVTAEKGSPEQDEALIYCMENAPADLKEMIKKRFVEFHTGKLNDHNHGEGCGCDSHPGKPSPSDFIR